MSYGENVMSKTSRIITSIKDVICSSCDKKLVKGTIVFRSRRKGKTKYWCVSDAKRLNYL